MIMSSSTSKRGRFCKSVDEDGNELRRGPWTLEEDNLLIQHITAHGEGQWNSLAISAGLKRTGKSCRLRWLNYLKPDVKRGNLTPHEQLLILELHSRWGNRWSKIAQHMPGRTDNEIKNYWRTRVQKQARQLKVDSNSSKFLEAVRLYWMPRLLEKIEQNSSSSSETPDAPVLPPPCPESDAGQLQQITGFCTSFDHHVDIPAYDVQEFGCGEMSVPDCHAADADWFAGDELGTSFWNTDELWQFRKVIV